MDMIMAWIQRIRKWLGQVDLRQLWLWIGQLDLKDLEMAQTVGFVTTMVMAWTARFGGFGDGSESWICDNLTLDLEEL